MKQEVKRNYLEINSLQDLKESKLPLVVAILLVHRGLQGLVALLQLAGHPVPPPRSQGKET